ncbi:HNH endonuclease [Sediminibacillus sp. JSM 1682029]|uniref:HNH endonuclease n=1 Tax=Sediminibacillus sp. JSM 1682029 TaxID=3229857 RepID=UPI0035260753
MRYCGEQGCKQLIAKGRYCEDHRRKKRKKVVYSKNKSFYRTRDWKDLKAYCYQRDGGCCQRCGKFVFGKRSHHHHIVPIQIDPSLKLDPDNIMTLCSKCHPIVEKETMEEYFPKKKSDFDWKL